MATVEDACEPQPALSHGAGAFASVSVFRTRSAAGIAPALRALGPFEAHEGDPRVLVGVDAEAASKALALGDIGASDARRVLVHRSRAGGWIANTQSTFFVQVASSTRALQLETLRRFDALLLPWCWPDEEVLGGWDLDAREPLGFLENPEGRAPLADVVVPRGPGRGGTWLLYLRFELARSRFLERSLRARERAVGVTIDGEPLPEAAPDSHVSRMHVYRTKLLRRGFPYRAAGVDGLAFVAVASERATLARAVDAFYGTDDPPDPLVPYAEAVSGGVYFVPARGAIGRPQ